MPLPKHKISLLVPFPDLPAAIKAVPQVIRARAVPTAVEFMEREVILAAEQFLARKFPDNSADAYLLLTFDGGIGFAKRSYLAESLPEAEKIIMRGIKQTFDPQNILNPGKVISL